ncbi:hypothetical protein APL35_gp160 [Apis mellifera filamentous virus]|uniref:hypothetical protein n=1 Tax=Apis mellifera filamentous virus TaxID=1100043 RepID=UPI0006BD4890|nr:hypothetical protein APL35_gp160 [Apis mellifera filamentous virus]
MIGSTTTVNNCLAKILLQKLTPQINAAREPAERRVNGFTNHMHSIQQTQYTQ